jgi:ABC-2 type transport system ATP-binding protein
VSQAVQVRRRIGVVPQRPNPDRSLNVIENLLFPRGVLRHPGDGVAPAANALLEQLGIAEKAHAKVDEMSGGQQQRLMIARALIHEPQVIFLDEPTVGLDPQTRLSLWEILRSLHGEGRTIVMTTHYMEEADSSAIGSPSSIVASSSSSTRPAALKQRAPGGTLVEVTLSAPTDSVLEPIRKLEGVLRAEAQGLLLRVFSDRGGRVISPVIQAAEDMGVAVTNIHLTSQAWRRCSSLAPGGSSIDRDSRRASHPRRAGGTSRPRVVGLFRAVAP